MTTEQVLINMECRWRKEYSESEYSKRGSVFYISYNKWKRLSSRMCRVRCTICLFDNTGTVSTRISLDSGKCDNIGCSRESLDQYVRKVFMFPKTKWKSYNVESWKIQAA